MDKKVLLQDLSEALAQRKGLAKKDAEQFVRTVFEIIEQYLENDKIVKIKGLGTFKLVAVDSRESVDVNTGERITIKGYTKISFVPDAQLRDQINKPFAHFETVTLNEGVDWDAMERIDEEGSLDTLQHFDNVTDEQAKTTESDAIADTLDTHTTVDTTPQEIEEVVTIEQIEAQPINEQESLLTPHLVENTERDQKEEEQSHQEAPPISQEDNIAQNELLQQESDAPIELTQEKESTTECNEETAQNNPDWQTQQIEHQHNDYLKVEEQHVSSQQVDHQHAEVQQVDEQKIDVQKVENQTVQNQHVIQSAPQEATLKTKSLSWWNLFWIALVVLMLMLASYFAGYYHLLCPYGCVPFKHMQKTEETLPSKATQKARTVRPVSPPMQKDTIHPDTLHEKSADPLQYGVQEKSNAAEKEKKTAAKLKEKEKKEEPSETIITVVNKDTMLNKYAQLPGGKYQITGTQRTHILKEGETLRAIAQQVYGSKNYVPYITVHNKIHNPDLIQAGKAIKLPELKLKVQ